MLAPGEDPRRVLGIEGTAWAGSAAIFDVVNEDVTIETAAYRPETGGIHPREAAEHMREHLPRVIDETLTTAGKLAETDDRTDTNEAPIDCVAFSQGPGLGPTLRIAATAARSVAGMLDVPLVGVNHMIAHLEIGRHESGFTSPVCLNASGANAHVLGYNGGRYRVLGETMDTGVGNALDKFARHVGWSHPGGPTIEEHARTGDYYELPYVVKGMDFSFSGLTSAAEAAVDDGVPIEDVCRGLEESIFGMLTEVSERAISLTGSEELVLGGGVGQNQRLQSMLATMCDERDASFHVPANRFLRDNAGMIAVLGSKMFAAGDTISIEDSRVRPAYRPDDVPVTWRESTERTATTGGDSLDSSTNDRPATPDTEIEIRGAEAVVTITDEMVIKRRLPRQYRHPVLDAKLRQERTIMEARLTSEARRHGVPTPIVRGIDLSQSLLRIERVGDADLDKALTRKRVQAVGHHLATLHEAGLVHGDPTTRNVRVTTRGMNDDGGADVSKRRTYLIDFGLGYYTDDIEDFAMDLHVFGGSLDGTAANPRAMREAAATGYRMVGDERVLSHLEEIAERGRYL